MWKWFVLFEIETLCLFNPRWPIFLFCIFSFVSGDRFVRQTGSCNLPTKDMENPEELTSEHPCYNFSKPDEQKMEFYSPGYYNSSYPKCIDCILILEGKCMYILSSRYCKNMLYLGILRFTTLVLCVHFQNYDFYFGNRAIRPTRAFKGMWFQHIYILTWK